MQQRDKVRERICFATLQDVIARVGEHSAVQSGLLNRLFRECAALEQNKARHQLEAAAQSMQAGVDAQSKQLQDQFEAAVRAQQAQMVELRIQNEHLSAEKQQQGVGVERLFEKTKGETLAAVKRATDQEIEIARLQRDLASAKNHLERQVMLVNKCKQDKFKLQDDPEQSHSVQSDLRETIGGLEEELSDKRDRSLTKGTQFDEQDTPDHARQQAQEREIRASRVLKRTYRRFRANKAAAAQANKAFRAAEAFLRPNSEELQVGIVPWGMQGLINEHLVRTRITAKTHQI
jgi:hypothetical protein